MRTQLLQYFRNHLFLTKIYDKNKIICSVNYSRKFHVLKTIFHITEKAFVFLGEEPQACWAGRTACR